MSVVAIVPVRSLTTGKTRLGTVLGRSERYQLNERFLSHTLRVTTAFAVSTVVVSRCADVLQLARSSGVGHLFEVTRGGLNPALTNASKVARARGAVRIVILPADLPFVCADDLHALVSHAGRAGATIAPDQRRDGTNALCVPAGHSFRFQFGASSFFKHKCEAENVGLNMTVISRPSLAFDIDLPADFSRLQALEGSDRDTHFTNGLQNVR